MYMKVKDLIERLNKLNLDDDLHVGDYGYVYPLHCLLLGYADFSSNDWRSDDNISLCDWNNLTKTGQNKLLKKGYQKVAVLDFSSN